MNADFQDHIFTPDDVNTNKVHALCAYLHVFVGFPLFLIPLLMAPDSRYARFHGDQGLTHFLFMFVILIIGIIPIIGWILIFPLIVTWFILGFLGLINAAKGLGKRLPLIGRWTFLGPKIPPKESA